MIERKFIPLIVAVFVLTAGLSGSATVAVLSDSETVQVQVSPDNVTATVLDNATTEANATTTNTEENATEELTIDDVDGLIVALEPADKTINPGETAEYDVVVKGATDGIVSYDMTLELSDSSVASFEGFEHHHSGSSSQTITDNGARINASAGLVPAIPNMSANTSVVLGTVTVAGDGDGTTSLEPINETGNTLSVVKNTTGEYEYYDVGAMDGSTVTSANEPPTAADDSYSVLNNVTLVAPVLDNDDDPDGDELTASIVSPPSDGELTLKEDGSFVYDPASNVTGQAEFTYEVRDGNGGVDNATATIQVSSSN